MMKSRNNLKDQQENNSTQAILQRPRHHPTSFYGREITTHAHPLDSSSIGTITRRMSDPAISKDDATYLTDFFTFDPDLIIIKPTPSPKSSPLEINTRRIINELYASPSSATATGSSGIISDLSGISTNSSPPISTRFSFDSPDNSREDKLDNVPEEKSAGMTATPRKEDIESDSEEEKAVSVQVRKIKDELAVENLTKQKQNEAQNKILAANKGLFIIKDNPDPSDETIMNVMNSYSTHIWEENLEILALARMAAVTGSPVGIYYKKGINDIKTVVATGEAADGEEGFAAGRVAVLNADLNEQNEPVVWYNNLTGARKVFDFKKKKPIIFIPICYTSARGHRLENKEFEAVVNYFARSRNCEVIVYLGRDAGDPVNIIKREEWLKPHAKYLASMVKFGATLLHRAQFVKTTYYIDAEKLFLNKINNRDKVSQKYCEDIILRLEQKKQLPTKRHTSPLLTGTVPDKKKTSPKKIITQVVSEIKEDDFELQSQASPRPSPKAVLNSSVAFFSEVKSAKSEEEIANLANFFTRVVTRGGKSRSGVTRNLEAQFRAVSSQATPEANHSVAQTESGNTSLRPKLSKL